MVPFSGSEIAFETANPVFDVQGCDFEMQPHHRRRVVKECSHSDPSAQEQPATLSSLKQRWCALQDLNLRPLPCEGSALPLS